MPIHDFIVGDRLRVRQWGDMAEEFGEDDGGGILCEFYFPLGMEDLCGQPFTVNNISGRNYYSAEGTEFINSDENGGPWSISGDMLEYMDDMPVPEIDPQSLMDSVFGGDTFD